MAASARRVRFGPFEVDLVTGEVRKGNIRRHLVGQPFEILALLLERPGDLVTRDEIRTRLWPEGTFVDFEHGLNAAVNKLREALGDSAERPSYVETIPRRGYRFIAAVEPVAAEPADPRGAASEAAAGPAARPARAAWKTRALVGAAVAVLAAGAVLVARGVERQKPVRSLAVLPFEDLGGDSAEPWFADGMTEAVLSRLAQLGSLRVISPTSAMRFRERPPALGEIARRLAVDGVVEGTVLRAGGKVRVSVKLVRTENGQLLWSGSFERALSDVLTLQGEIARTVSREIHARLTATERWRLSQSRPVDPAAYASYLRGRFFQRKETAWANVKALESFHEAVEKDPAWAPAWVALAETEVFGDPPVESMPRAKAAALRALTLDPDLAEAHAALGLALTYWDHDWRAAEAAFRRALALDARSVDAHHRFSLLLMVQGRFDEALDHDRQASELDPLSANVLADLGRLHFFARRHDEAEKTLKTALEMDPNHPWALLFLGSVYEAEGRYGEAMAQWKRLAAAEGVDAGVVAGFDGLFAKEGYEAVLRRFRTTHKSPSPVARARGDARRLIRLGDFDAAIASLERAYAGHARDLIYLNVDPGFDRLRGDPRFTDLLRRVGF